MKTARSGTLELSHPPVDTFERVLEKGVVVEDVRDARPGDRRSKSNTRLHVSIVGMDQLDVTSSPAPPRRPRNED